MENQQREDSYSQETADLITKLFKRSSQSNRIEAKKSWQL